MTAENRFEQIEKSFAAPEAAPVADTATTDEAVTDKTESAPVENAAPEKTERKKPGIQDRINELTRSKHERERQIQERDAEIQRLKSELENKAPKTEEPKEDPNREKTLDDFDWDMERFLEYQAEMKLDKKLKEREEKTQSEAKKKAAEERQSKFFERVEKFMEIEPSFFEDLINPETSIKGLAFTPPMEEFIMDSDVGPQIAWHFRNHPEESQAIASLDSRGVERAMARLEAKLSAEPVAEPVSQPAITRAPPVAKRIGSSSVAGTSGKAWSMDDEIAAVRAKRTR